MTTPSNADLQREVAALLVEALNLEIAPDAIRQALADTKNFQGATGTMTMDKDRNANKPIVVVQIKEKKFKYATQIMAK